MIVAAIIGLEGCRRRPVGFVLVAASGIVEQGWNDRQQHDHDDEHDGDARNHELCNVHITIMARRAVKSIYLTLSFAEQITGTTGSLPGGQLDRMAR